MSTGRYACAVPSAAERFCALPNDVQLCFRTYGQPDAEPLLLIAGLGLDLTWWPTALIDGLVRRGFFVITFDNRDAGRSSRGHTPAPGLWRLLLGWPRADGYDLSDMADDVAHLLDGLGLPSVHAVGMSMGGMIGHMLAVRHPARVRSLTSIFSTTGERGVGGAALSTMWLLARGPAKNEQEAAKNAVRIVRHISAGPYGFDEQETRDYATRAWRRADGARAHAGFSRQINAIRKSGDRTAALRTIDTPTLVLHGDEDRMVHPSGGQATAAAIAGAERVTVQGMRHGFPSAVVPQLVVLIAKHAMGRRRSGGATTHVEGTK